MAPAIKTFKRSRSSVGIRLMLLLTLCWIALQPGEGRAQAAPSTEYQVKAALLLNFVQFIQWPAAAFVDSTTPITVGVLGDDPFGVALDQTFQGESVEGRKLVIKRSRQIEDLKLCQLVFVSKSEKDHVAEILTGFNNASTVTVSEIDSFAQQGGIINFYIDNNKIRFEINAETAERKSLKISSQLLKRARIVGSDPRKGR